MKRSMRFLLVPGLCGLLGLGCVTDNVRRAEQTPQVIAHRGASHYAPENTLAAFERAADLGADWFELDCNLSRDGEIVVIHDDTVDRTTDFEGKVSGLDYVGEMDRYDAGSWFDSAFASERLPTLGQALDLADRRGIGVYIEIKNSDDDSALMDVLLAIPRNGEPLLPDRGDRVMSAIVNSGSRNLELTRKVIAEVKARRMRRAVVIQSFSPVVCAVALIEAPRFRTELLAYNDDEKPKVWKRYLMWAELLDPAGFNIRMSELTDELLRDFHARGKTVAIWTVNEEEEMYRLIRQGVDAIITNRPDVCIEARDAVR